MSRSFVLETFPELNVAHPRFTDNIDRSGLPAFLNEGIQYYCDQLTDENE